MGKRDLLDESAIAAALRAVAWVRDGDAIDKTVKLPTFPAAIEFVRRVAAVAESMDHHPDIDIRWRTVKLRSSTHSTTRPLPRTWRSIAARWGCPRRHPACVPARRSRARTRHVRASRR